MPTPFHFSALSLLNAFFICFIWQRSRLTPSQKTKWLRLSAILQFFVLLGMYLYSSLIREGNVATIIGFWVPLAIILAVWVLLYRWVWLRLRDFTSFFFLSWGLVGLLVLAVVVLSGVMLPRSHYKAYTFTSTLVYGLLFGWAYWVWHAWNRCANTPPVNLRVRRYGWLVRAVVFAIICVTILVFLALLIHAPISTLPLELSVLLGGPMLLAYPSIYKIILRDGGILLLLVWGVPKLIL